MSTINYKNLDMNDDKDDDDLRICTRDIRAKTTVTSEPHGTEHFADKDVFFFFLPQSVLLDIPPLPRALPLCTYLLPLMTKLLLFSRGG